jgi:uncharacterized lipoprotein YajG
MSRALPLALLLAAGTLFLGCAAQPSQSSATPARGLLVQAQQVGVPV